MNRPLLLAVSVVVIGIATLPSAVARGKVWDQIVSVDKNTQAITLAEGTKHVRYAIGTNTKVLVNGHESSFAALKPKMEATVMHKSGSVTADLVNAHTLVAGQRHHRGHR